MLRKRKEVKPKKSVAETSFLCDMQGTAAEKLAFFEKLKARGGFASEDRASLAEAEKMLRAFAAMEKNG